VEHLDDGLATFDPIERAHRRIGREQVGEPFNLRSSTVCPSGPMDPDVLAILGA
jgi:hypothetical protein